MERPGRYSCTSSRRRLSSATVCAGGLPRRCLGEGAVEPSAPVRRVNDSAALPSQGRDLADTDRPDPSLGLSAAQRTRRGSRKLGQLQRAPYDMCVSSGNLTATSPPVALADYGVQDTADDPRRTELHPPTIWLGARRQHRHDRGARAAGGHQAAASTPPGQGPLVAAPAPGTEPPTWRARYEARSD